jgi:hypothetical protein
VHTAREMRKVAAMLRRAARGARRGATRASRGSASRASRGAGPGGAATGGGHASADCGVWQTPVAQGRIDAAARGAAPRARSRLLRGRSAARARLGRRRMRSAAIQQIRPVTGCRAGGTFSAPGVPAKKKAPYAIRVFLGPKRGCRFSFADSASGSLRSRNSSDPSRSHMAFRGIPERARGVYG